MSLIGKKGNEVLKNLNEPEHEYEKVDFKELYIRLKEKESITVRLLGTEDFISYKAHASGFALGLYSTPCIAPLGKECPLCKVNKYAYENGHDDEMKGTKVTERYLVAMVDLATEKIRLWDCSKGQLKSFLEDLEDYKDMIEEGEEIYFKFSRSGSGKETKYSLKPILAPKQLNEVKAKYSEVFRKFDGVEVQDSDFEKGLVPKAPEKLIQEIFDSKISHSSVVFNNIRTPFVKNTVMEDEDIPF